MKTIKTKTFGTSTEVRAEVSIGVLLQIHDRFGGLKPCLERIEKAEIPVLMFCLEQLMVAGGLDPEQAGLRAGEAIENGGINAVMQFLFEVFNHAIAKVELVPGEATGTVDPTTSTPKQSTASASP